jgi:hypothetical protein
LLCKKTCRRRSETSPSFGLGRRVAMTGRYEVAKSCRDMVGSDTDMGG